jgi:hypothetical protein
LIGGQKIMHLIHIIGHELYHARQEQEPEYAMKTKLNNIVGRFMIKNPNTHIAGTSKNPYQTDLGERSAEAFSIRYLKEMIKVVRSSGPKTLIERIILICYEVSYQDEFNALKAKIIN